MADVDPRAARRAELLQEKAEREEMARAAQETHVDLVLEQEAKWTKELGPRGSAFEIVNEDNDLGIGPIVVKAADDGAIKAWESTEGDTLESKFSFVRPCVIYPDLARFVALTTNRPRMIHRCSVALVVLAGAKRTTAAGKY